MLESDQPMSRSTLPANVLWREISFEPPNTPSVGLVVDRTLTPRERQSRVAQAVDQPPAKTQEKSRLCGRDAGRFVIVHRAETSLCLEMFGVD